MLTDGWFIHPSDRCNVCKYQYQYVQINKRLEMAIRLSGPLWPLVIIAVMSAALGFIPMFGPIDGNFGMYMLNGLTSLGLIYLCIIVAACKESACLRDLEPFNFISGSYIRFGHYFIHGVFESHTQSTVSTHECPCWPLKPQLGH
jgi:hypothetical protein